MRGHSGLGSMRLFVIAGHMDLEFLPLSLERLTAAAEVLNRGFADYFVPIVVSGPALEAMRHADALVLEDSLMALRGHLPLGVALVERRGRDVRLAGMAVVPEARRLGVGRELVRRLLDAARRRGDRRMVLEVIGQNESAVRLYEREGFMRQRRLAGFAGRVPDGLVVDAGLTEVGVSDVAAVVARQGDVDWPWQISAETLARLPAPATAFALGGAWAVVSNPAGPVAGFRAIAVEGGERRAERAIHLLRAVMARHLAVKEWRMSALLPEEFAGWFEGAGLARTELYQWQMQRHIA